MKKIGIFGGSFNPIHIGHLIIAEYFYYCQDLYKVIFVPTHISPFKQDEQQVVTDDDRLLMVKAITDEDARFECDDFEIRSKEISYTYNTVCHISEFYPKTEIHLLIGQDHLPSLDKWYEFDKLASQVIFCIANRNSLDNHHNDIISNSKGIKMVKLNTPKIEISSSAIREAIKNNKLIKYMLHRKTYKYIKDKGLYL